MFRSIYCICLIFIFFQGKIMAQVYSTPQNINGTINNYSKVTAIPSATSLTVSSTTGFAAGNKILIIQMQGATVNPITYTSAFGNITNINNAGNYETATIASVAGSTINLSNALTRTYTPSGNVQIVSVPQYNAGVTVTGTLTAAAWNGSTGGVLALESCGSGANGTITLNADIDVNNKGFRPGIINGGGGICYSSPYAYDNPTSWSDTVWNTGDVYLTCATATSASPAWSTVCSNPWRSPGNPGCGCYITVPNCNNAVIFDSATYNIAKNITCTGRTGYYLNTYTVNGGEKGEGIAAPITNLRFGRGAMANGGGGGNQHNGGGGGGGNYGAGGLGGMDLNACFVNLPASQKDSAARGIGGRTLATYYGQNKIFMGGGGGGSHANDNQNTPGTPGGGIVIMTANTLNNSGFKIMANALDNNSMATDGQSGANADGAGGAGAGGTVLLNVTTFVNALTVEAKGGRGAHNFFYNDPSQCYAPGGGGGGGAIWFKSGSTPAGITTNITGGAAGNQIIGGVPSARSCNGNDPRYGARAGNNGGVLYGLNLSSACTPLPVEWLSLSAQATEGNSILIEWSTASENNNQFFTIERSTDGIYWSAIHRMGAQQSPGIHNYSWYDDPENSTKLYYRILQTDIDGSTSYSPICTARRESEISFRIFPNPVGEEHEWYITAKFSEEEKPEIRIADLLGRVIRKEILTEEQDKFSVRDLRLSKGTYLVYFQTSQHTLIQKLVIE